MQKKKPEIRSRFTESAPVSSDTVGQADTQQQFAKEADINHKARQHLAGPNRLHPMGNPAATRVMRFADCTANDFQVMQNTLATVQAQFMGLPHKSLPTGQPAPRGLFYSLPQGTPRQPCR